MIRLERHAHGPRLYVGGVRVHEWQLGVGLLALVLAGWVFELWPFAGWTLLAAVAAGYMVAKDWRDLLPSRRDTGMWRVGLHRPPAPLRAVRYADGLPALAGLTAFVIGIVNLVSALTPNVLWRHRILVAVLDARAVPLFHTVAVPASLALIIAAFYVMRRRRRAWATAFALLVALGAVNLVKGLDIEEALFSWAGAWLLWWGRDAFPVQHEPFRWRSPLVVLSALVVALTALAAVAVWLASGRTAEPSTVLRETLDLLGWTHGTLTYTDELTWLPVAGAALTVASIVAAAHLLFRPLRASHELPDEPARAAAFSLVRSYGSDTLAFFKLRRDTRYLFSPDRNAFLSYRIENNVLLVSGDPVGRPEAMRELVREAVVFAEKHGLRVAAIGVGEPLLPLWRQAALHPLYIGDEAIVETAAFSLEGRAIRKVRQSVSRLEKQGYTADLHLHAELDERTTSELEAVSAAWRGGSQERGFSMAMDSLRGEHQAESLVVVARDASGAARGFLHFVPAYGRAAMSLSFMRREPATPNGLTEFLVVRSIELLRGRGIAELSLNFAAFGRLFDRPQTLLDRVLARLIAFANPFFQIESLYRFNAKFSPRWEPRYLVYEGRLGWPRAGLAALRAEGQLPRLRTR
jgi:lysyl-tRNA synthetase class 2